MKIRLLIRFTLVMLGSMFVSCLSTPSVQSLAQFEFLTQAEHAHEVLGYSPAIEYIPGTAARDNSVNLYLHGWQCNKHYCMRNPLFAKPAILFNFLDAKTTDGTSIKQSSFGQYTDMLPTLYILNAIVESNIADRINIIGFSRGAATAINVIGALNNWQSYKQTFKRLNIKRKRAKEILTCIERGIIVLDCPLKNVGLGLLSQVRAYRASIIADRNPKRVSLLTPLEFLFQAAISTFDYSCWACLNYLIFPCYTNYAPWREQPIAMLDMWKGLSVTTIVRYDKNDGMVTNDYDDTFYEKIRSFNPFTTFLIVTPGTGHCSKCPELVTLFNTLNNLKQMS